MATGHISLTAKSNDDKIVTLSNRHIFPDVHEIWVPLIVSVRANNSKEIETSISFIHFMLAPWPRTHQILIDVIVSWCAHENGTLHQSNKTPEGFRFIFDFAQNRRQEIAHALCVG